MQTRKIVWLDTKQSPLVTPSSYFKHLQDLMTRSGLDGHGSPNITVVSKNRRIGFVSSFLLRQKYDGTESIMAEIELDPDVDAALQSSDRLVRKSEMHFELVF